MASKLLLVSVFILDLIAFGFALAAEQRRSTATVTVDANWNYNYCVYHTDIATGLGVGSFILLLISQAIIMMATRCFCCGNALKSGGSRACAITLFMLCWVVFLMAEACLMVGSVRNGHHTKYMTIFGGGDPPVCETLQEGVFAGGAVLVFFTFIVSELYYYISFSNAHSPFEAYDKEASVGLITH